MVRKAVGVGAGVSRGTRRAAAVRRRRHATGPGAHCAGGGCAHDRAGRARECGVAPGKVTFWERLVQPHVFVALAARVGDLRRINRTRVEWDAIANGQFILTTRAAYQTVGTHQAVKESVVDDMALAQAYVRHHLDIFLTHGEQYMVTRMYTSLAGIAEGWTKNLATGVPLAFPPIPLVRRLAPYVMWLPALLWIVPPLAWAMFGWWWSAVTTLISLAIWVAVYWAQGAPLWYALLY